MSVLGEIKAVFSLDKGFLSVPVMAKHLQFLSKTCKEIIGKPVSASLYSHVHYPLLYALLFFPQSPDIHYFPVNSNFINLCCYYIYFSMPLHCKFHDINHQYLHHCRRIFTKMLLVKKYYIILSAITSFQYSSFF